MSQPADVSPVDNSDADPHGRQMEEIIPADRDYASPQSQDTEPVGRSWYEDYIVCSHEECTKCVVLILFRHKDDPPEKVTTFRTGIIVASGRTSCCIITSCLAGINDQVCEVQFCDGTKWAVGVAKVHQQFGMSMLFVYNVSTAEAKPAKFADSAVDLGEQVFTCGYSCFPDPTSGYSSSLIGRSFFSGSITSGVDMKDKTMEKANLFVHGCATGNFGHLGSAVFNERQSLVGMNVEYTFSRVENYRLPTNEDIGGIVSALDLTSIGLAFASVWKSMERKTIHEIVKMLTDTLLYHEGKQGG